MNDTKHQVRFSSWLLAAALFGVIFAASGVVTAAEQKIALVIGNAAYPTSKLRNPVNDAKAMAEKLKSLGFEVIVRTDSNLRDMTRAFSQFGQKLVPGSVSLFYYAGHGMQVQGKNYLIPVDAEIESEAAVRTEAVDVDQLLYQLGPARLSMVILDACRNNPFERRFRGAGGGLAQIDAPTGTLLAYATAPGKVAADGTGSNGLYTEALLRALDMPGLKVEDVFKQVRINVVKASDGLQTPWESSSLTGEFFFHPGTKAEIESAQLRQSEKERETLRQEMEKLRAELLRLRNNSPVAAAASPQLVSPAGSSSVAPVAAATSLTGTDMRIALAPPGTTAPAGTTSQAAEWQERIAAVERSKGTLTLAKAIAILLNISHPEELTALINQEKFIEERTQPSTLAAGIGFDGELRWALSWNWRLRMWADEAAVENCEKSGTSGCKIIIQNGSFNEAEFIQIARKLGEKSVEAVKQSYLKSLANPGKRFTTSIASGQGSNNNVQASVLASQ